MNVPVSKVKTQIKESAPGADSDEDVVMEIMKTKKKKDKKRK